MSTCSSTRRPTRLAGTTPSAISSAFIRSITTRSGSSSTGSWWTAKDSFDNGFGVCRDFAHLMVTLCRAISIPARYCSGYLPDMDVVPLPTPMDFHAWAQVWLGDRWWTFDPRHNERRKGHVVIAHGRDAADVAMITSFGQPNRPSIKGTRLGVPKPRNASSNRRFISR